LKILLTCGPKCLCFGYFETCRNKGEWFKEQKSCRKIFLQQGALYPTFSLYGSLGSNYELPAPKPIPIYDPCIWGNYENTGLVIRDASHH